MWVRFWDYARKAGVAVVGVVATGVAYGMFPDPWDKVATAVLALATYAGVYATRNDVSVAANVRQVPNRVARDDKGNPVL